MAIDLTLGFEVGSGEAVHVTHKEYLPILLDELDLREWSAAHRVADQIIPVVQELNSGTGIGVCIDNNTFVRFSSNIQQADLDAFMARTLMIVQHKTQGSITNVYSFPQPGFGAASVKAAYILGIPALINEPDYFRNLTRRSYDIVLEWNETLFKNSFQDIQKERKILESLSEINSQLNDLPTDIAISVLNGESVKLTSDSVLELAENTEGIDRLWVNDDLYSLHIADLNQNLLAIPVETAKTHKSSDDILRIVEQEIMQFCDSHVPGPEYCYEDCLYHDMNTGFHFISLGHTRIGEEDELWENGLEYIHNKFAMVTLNYLQPGKDTIPLITCFADFDGGVNRGPVRYCYPDGSLAGFEYYNLNKEQYSPEFKDELFASDFNEEMSFYFSPEGKQISKYEFDALFGQVLKSFQLEKYTYNPRRWEEYDDLAAQFCRLTNLGPEVSLISFHHKVASWPEEKLKLIEERISQNNFFKNEPATLESNIKKYLYGNINQKQSSSKKRTAKSPKDIYRELCQKTQDNKNKGLKK